MMLAQGMIICIFVVSGTVADNYRRLGEDDERMGNYGKPTEIRYDEYPIVIPKRSAIMLDRLLVALQSALEDDSNFGDSRAAPVGPRQLALRGEGAATRPAGIAQRRVAYADEDLPRVNPKNVRLEAWRRDGGEGEGDGSVAQRESRHQQSGRKRR